MFTGYPCLYFYVNSDRPFISFRVVSGHLERFSSSRFRYPLSAEGGSRFLCLSLFFCFSHFHLLLLTLCYADFGAGEFVGRASVFG